MSCTAKDGRHVTGALGVGHSSMVVLMVTHMVTRGILGAGGYRLTAAVLLVHDRTDAIVIVVIVVVVDAAVIVGTTATAAADVGAAAAIVVGRIQRRLAGVVQSMLRVLLLCCFQICCFYSFFDVPLPLGGSLYLRKDCIWCHWLRSLQFLHKAELIITVFLGFGRDVGGGCTRLEPLVAGSLFRCHALLWIPFEAFADEIDERGIVAAECLRNGLRARFPLASFGIGYAPWNASRIEKQPPPGGSIDEIIWRNAQNFHDTR